MRSLQTHTLTPNSRHLDTFIQMNPETGYVVVSIFFSIIPTQPQYSPNIIQTIEEVRAREDTGGMRVAFRAPLQCVGFCNYPVVVDLFLPRVHTSSEFNALPPKLMWKPKEAREAYSPLKKCAKWDPALF